MEKELFELNREIHNCRKCILWKTRTNAVPGAGKPSAKIMFIGEAPGREEDLQGMPFVGMAGRLLNELLAWAGLKRGEVYITSILKCRPPSNRKPKEKEIKACMPWLKNQIGLIGPKIICLLGLVAAKAILEEEIKIEKFHGRVIEKNSWKYFILYHPAAGVRNKNLVPIMKKDFQKLKSINI